MATALKALAGTTSLGNVRALTAQARKDSASGADASRQLQEQIDKMLGMVKEAFVEVSGSAPTVLTSGTISYAD